MSISRLPVAAAALMLIAFGVLVPSAAAHHSAAASASLTLEPLDPSCRQTENAPRTRCNGSRVARTDWSVTCGAESAIIEIDYLAARPGDRPPVGIGNVEVDTPGLNGLTRKRVGAGTRVLGVVTVYCDTVGDGNTIGPHRVVASAITATALIAPRLVKVEAVTNGFCGFIPTNTQLKFSAQAGETVGVDYKLLFNEQSLLGTDRRKSPGLRRQRLFVRGAGVSYRGRPLTFIPGAGGRIRVAAGARVAVRRKGRLRFSALIGGVRTNSLAFPVFGRRC